jgi:hypothetical protein
MNTASRKRINRVALREWRHAFLPLLALLAACEPQCQPSTDEGCSMNLGGKDGDLALLTISLHHRADHDGVDPLDEGPLKAGDIYRLAHEITTYWDRPEDLVVLLVNSPGRNPDGYLEPCEWTPSMCLRDRLQIEYPNAKFEEANLGWVSPNMAIITGSSWHINRAELRPYPQWIRDADSVNPGHYGLFTISPKGRPEVELPIASAYLPCCDSSAGEGGSKALRLRHVMNTMSATESRLPPIVAGDWNFLVNGELADTLQVEIRNRSEWVDDVNANACFGTSTFSFGPARNERKVHETVLTRRSSHTLVPTYHPFSHETVGTPEPVTELIFESLLHRGFLTVFDVRENEQAPRPSLDVTASATGTEVDHDCGYPDEGAWWAEFGQQEKCWMASGPHFRPAETNGYRVAVRGRAVGGGGLFGGADVRINVVSELPDQGFAALTLWDEIVHVENEFCVTRFVSGLQGQALDIRFSREGGHSIAVSDMRITDLDTDPCE